VRTIWKEEKEVVSHLEARTMRRKKKKMMMKKRKKRKERKEREVVVMCSNTKGSRCLEPPRA